MSLRRASVDAPQPVARASQDLGGHPDDQLSEVAPLQHSDESARRVFETVDDVLAVADATIGDAGADLAQKCGVVRGGKFVVDEAAHRQALRQSLPHGGGQPVGAVAPCWGFPCGRAARTIWRAVAAIISMPSWPV